MPTQEEIDAARALIAEHDNAVKAEFFAAKDAYRADPTDDAAKARYFAAVAALYPPDEPTEPVADAPVEG